MFGRIIPSLVEAIPFNFVHWSTLFLAIAVIVTLLLNGKFRKPNAYILKLLQFNLFFSGVVLAKGLMGGNLQEALNLSSGVNVSTLVILFVTQQSEFGQNERFFRVVSLALGIMMIIQTAVSAIESSRGVLFGQYLVNIYGSLEGRDILNLFGLSQQKLFGFTIPFTGLIGTHNPFGIMLLFFTIYFLSEYEIRKSGHFYVFFMVILFALVGNGTRSALFLVLFSVTFFFLFAVSRKSNVAIKSLIVILLATIIGFFSQTVWQILSDFYYQSDTLTYRVLLWQGVLERFFNVESFSRLLFGLRVEEIKMATLDVAGAIVSVESEYLRISLTAGAVGLILFIRAFGVYLTKECKQSFRRTQLSLTLLSLNVFLISVVMTGVIFYAVYFIVTLTILQAAHYKLLDEKKSWARAQQTLHLPVGLQCI